MKKHPGGGSVGGGMGTAPRTYTIHCFFFCLPPFGGSLKKFLIFIATQNQLV